MVMVFRSEINHLSESGAENVVGCHQNFPLFLSDFHDYYSNLSGISWSRFSRKTFHSCALSKYFARPTKF
jgi:hypothetical protein